MSNVPILRQSESGPFLTYPTSMAGELLTVQPDGTVKPGGGGGPGGATFSDVFYCDAGTTSTTGNGSVNNPFKTLAAALLLASTVTNSIVYATPESYAAEGTLAPTANVSIVGMGPSGGTATAVQAINTTHTLVIENLTVIGGITATSVFTAVGCSVFGITNTGGIVNLTNSTEVGAITGATLGATGSTIVGNITLTAGGCQFINCAFGNTPVLTFVGAPGVVNFDSTSYNNFFAAGGTIVNGSFTSHDPNVPKIQLTAPQTLAQGGAGAYVTLTADGGAAMTFDCTGIPVTSKIEVGIDATATDATTGVHSELRANRTYVMAGGVPTLLNDSTSFTPALISGHAAVQLAIVGATLALQGWKEAAGGHDEKFVGKLYITVSNVSA